MKKNRFVLFTICILILGSNSNAQKMYIGISGGYGFGVNKQAGYDLKSVGSGFTQTSNPYSLGQGICGSLYAGYMVHKNIGLELGFSYLQSSRYTRLESQDYSPFTNNTSTTKAYGRMMRIIPAMVFTAGNKKLRPYLKAGIIIGAGGKLFNEQTNIETISPASNAFYKYEFTGGMSFGFHGSTGINIFLGNMCNVFIEFAGNFQTWSPAKRTLTEYTYNGADRLDMLTVSQKETVYVKAYTVNGTQDVNLPSKQLKQYFPYSSVGLNLGVNFVLGREKKK